MSDDLSWRCMHEKDDENLFCPPEGCPKEYGCARDKGWKFGDPTPLGCIGYVTASHGEAVKVRDAEIARLQAELNEAREIIKSFHLDHIDYSVLNHLSGHNHHNVRWARRFLGMKEEWSLDEARAFLKGETDA